MPRFLLADEMCAPHLMLSHAGHVESIGAGEGAQALQYVLGGSQTIIGLGVPKGVVVLDGIKFNPPLPQIRQLVGELGGEQFIEFGEHIAQITHDRHVCEANLGDFCRVYVNVDDLGFGGERVEFTGHAVVKTGP